MRVQDFDHPVYRYFSQPFLFHLLFDRRHCSFHLLYVPLWSHRLATLNRLPMRSAGLVATQISFLLILPCQTRIDGWGAAWVVFYLIIAIYDVRLFIMMLTRRFDLIITRFIFVALFIWIYVVVFTARACLDNSDTVRYQPNLITPNVGFNRQESSRWQ